MTSLIEARKLMRTVIEILKISSERSDYDAFGQGLGLAAPLYMGSALQNVPAEEKKSFRTQVAELIGSDRNPGLLLSYMSDCEHYARMSKLDGFKKSCQMRSNIQIINDEFTPLDTIFSPANLEILDDAEEVYRENADDIPPIPEEEIPSWTPESHWWWRIPKRKNMGTEEINDRLHYDRYDGLES
ncbi:hypothetical protein ACFVWN_19355 [Nocardiopsis flavescens]|uniref:hypothetical protein n=1 Tax=Nocardiopsis flavescens TaxID=758803 RepID=UPI00365BF6DB